MVLRSLPLLGLILLTGCGGTAAEKLEDFGEKIEDISEDIQSGGDNVIDAIIDNSIEVYIAKGNTQCNDDGLTLEETVGYLVEADVEVSESQCAVLEGIAYPAVCGGGTADIYVHTINLLDVLKAENAGFSDSSLLSSEVSYTIVDCPAS